MGEDGTGHGEKSIWGRTAPSSHAQRFPPCQAFPLRVSPLWIHGHLHHQGHDAGLDRLVASPPSYPAVLPACQCRPWKQGLLGAAGGQGPGVVDCVYPFGSDHGSQLSLPERGLVVQSFSSLGYTRCVWQMADSNGSAARVRVTTMALAGDPSGRGSSQLLPLHPPLLGAGPSNRHRRAWIRTHLRWGTEHISRSHKLSHRPLGRFWYDDAKPFVWWRTAAPFGLDLGDVGVQVPALLCSPSPYAPQP